MFGFMLNGFIWVFFRKNEFDLFYYLTGAFNSHSHWPASQLGTFGSVRRSVSI